MLFVAGIGILGVMATFAVSFMPPEDINVGSLLRYELTLIVGLVVMCAPPFITTWTQTKGRKEIDLEPAL
jgi:hypothetical protein